MVKTKPGFFTWNELAERIQIKNPTDVGSLCSRWIVPPFSVLDSRQSYWQKRKRQWANLGIQSELGRGEAITWGIDPNGTSTKDPSTAWTEKGKSRIKRIDPSPGGSPRPASNYSKRERGDGRGRPLARAYSMDLMRGEDSRYCRTQPKINKIYGRGEDAGDTPSAMGTSIFDPCLTECIYQWFAPAGGHILDPFCGGSVRGIVASITGRKYSGIDLSERQISANRIQGQEICSEPMPEWIHGDSGDVQTLARGPFDLVFSCPPYFNLELYSDDPADLSTMTWDKFLTSYRHIISESCSMLRNNRFACFVVSQIRDKKTGAINDLVGETVRAFEAAGLHFYNDFVLLNAIGSAPVRAHKQFLSGRKCCRTHQNVLVFCKGDWRLAVQELDNSGINGSYI